MTAESAKKTASDYLRVPYGMTVHGQEEIDAVVNVLKTSTQMGPNIRAFESKVATLFDKQHGIMVNSGSSALMLAVELLDLPEGSEVITPALTFSTTVSYILRNRLIPAYVDVGEGTYIIDPARIEAMITPKTKAILAPHLIGNLINWEDIMPLIRKYNLRVIEDSADTLGSKINGKPSGALPEICTTSFYGSHVINGAGNGGMVCVRDRELADRARLLRSWGRSSSLFVESEAVENRFNVQVDGVDYDAKFVFEKPGHNIEGSELGAAFGLVQLKNLDANIRTRIRHFSEHTEFFKKYEDWFILPRETPGSYTGWLAYPLTLREGAPFKRRDMQIFLERRNIQTRVIFTGNITRQPGFKDQPMKKSPQGYPEADKVMCGGMLLGCHHGLTAEMLAHVRESFEDFASQF